MKTSKRLTAILLAGFMSLIMVPYASATQNDLAIPEDVVRSMEANNVELLDWSEVPEGIVPMEFDTWEEALAYLEEFSAVPQHQESHFYPEEKNDSNVQPLGVKTQRQDLRFFSEMILQADVDTTTYPWARYNSVYSCYIQVPAHMILNVSITNAWTDYDLIDSNRTCQVVYGYSLHVYVSIGGLVAGQTNPYDGTAWFYANAA